MTEEQERLLRENHELLKEIVGYLREYRTPEYRDREDIKQFCINIVADILVDGMEESARENIRKSFKSKG